MVFAFGVVLFGTGCAAPLVAETAEVLRNDKVVVTEETLTPGQQETLDGKHASVAVYLAGDDAHIRFANGKTRHEAIVRGETVNEPAETGTLTNTGKTALKLVRVEFLTAGNKEVWGRSGLAPNYQMIFENEHSRVYDIRIAAQKWEPEHTHHDRVVVCLSGAQLEHVLADGSKQASTLKTDEVAWRLGQTHKGHNLGDTNLWVVAIEPK